ncbi:MAG: methyltransferase, FkbM family [Erythrobacteraceae bacterium HL-111]|nr:MAG: methyltransferase, FkbM family [Erythrobacteraceae bacterium HL-111]
MRHGSVIWVDMRSHTEWYALWSGQYDEEFIGLLAKLLAAFPGSFLDVGGNIGMYAVRVSRLSGCKTICFEPMPRNTTRIRQNAQLNGVEGELEVLEIALSDHEGSADLVLREDFVAGSQTGNASIAISNEADGLFERIKVPVLRFDDFLAGRAEKNIFVAKVDIEGHEDFFLRGAEKWLGQNRPVILTEINNWFYLKRGTTSAAAFSQSLPRDYSVALVSNQFGKYLLEEIPVEQLADLKGLHNCLLYPPEKSELINSVISYGASE